MFSTLPGAHMLTRSMAIALVAGGLVALPATSWPATEPEAITPDIESIPVSGVDADALSTTPEPEEHGPAAGKLEPVVVTEKIKTDVEFGLVGVVFDKPPPKKSELLIRVKEGQAWTAWQELSISDGHGPDLGDPDYNKVKPSTEPLLTDPANEVQVRIDTPNGEEPVGTKIKIVEATESPADRSLTDNGPALATANAAASQPAIVSRAAWGANERLRGGCAGLTDAHRMAFVHHTASTSNYTPSQAPSQLRAIYSWTTSNGFCDMPYNFMVDRYGTIYEGRGGGISLPVKSGATASFNSGSVAVSGLGNFMTAPSNGLSAMDQSIAHVIAWKLALTNRAADGWESLTAEGYRGGAPRGQVRTFNRISGHRNAYSTSCPGDALYADLPQIRVIAAGIQGPDVGTPIAGAPAAIAPVGRLSSSVTQWSKTVRTRRRGRPYKSSFNLTPGAGRSVQIRRKRVGKRWSNGRRWKVVQTVTTDTAGYARFRLKFLRTKSGYRLVAPATSSATRTRNGVMYLVGRSRR